MEKSKYTGFEVKRATQKEKSLEWLPRVRAYYAGETHTHSRWSDRHRLENGGREKRVHELTRVLEYADKLGLRFIFFSEHASNPGRPAKLTPDHPICLSLLEEKQRLDEINSSGRFKTQALLANEISIFFDENDRPSLDLPEEIMDRLDLIIASRHAITNQYEPAKIKESFLAAINNPAVDIIGHPYRHIEFYEHDWRYFKKYWRNKNENKYQYLLKLEQAEDWDSIKKIIGKLPPDSNKEIEAFALDFQKLKHDYWQAWKEVLSAMEEKGKVFEINLNTFLPQKEFYRTLLVKAARYKKLKFSIAYDFHTLDQGQSQDKVPDVPEIKNPSRAGRLQRLLDLIKLLEEFNIDKNRIINSSFDNLKKFLHHLRRE